MLLSIDEVLTGIDQLKTKEERVATLKKYKHDAIEAILRGAFDPDIKWALPAGPVPYRASGAIDQQGMLYSEYKQFYIFIEGSCPNLRQARRELLFVQFLESLHPADAALMSHVKDKHLPYPNITPELVDEAFPDCLEIGRKKLSRCLQRHGKRGRKKIGMLMCVKFRRLLQKSQFHLRK